MDALSFISRWVAGGIGVVWCMVEPTAPFLLLCVFAMVGDIVTAWMLNRRVRRVFGEKASDGKLKSRHMSKILPDMLVLFSVILLAYHVDGILLSQLGDLHLAQYVSAVYCLIQVTSMLENQSSCNDATWAKILQKVLADKTKRHLKIDLLNPDAEVKDEDEPTDSTDKTE